MGWETGGAFRKRTRVSILILEQFNSGIMRDKSDLDLSEQFGDFSLGGIKFEDYPSAATKLSDLFAEWLSYESTKRLIEEISDDLASKGEICSASSREDRLAVMQPPRSPTKPSPKKRSQSEMADQSSVGSSLTQESTSPPGSSSAAKMLSSLSLDGKSGNEDDSFDGSDGGALSRRRANFDSIPVFFQPKDSKNSVSGSKHKKILEDQLSRRLPEIEAMFKPFPNGMPVEKFVHATKRLCGFPSFFNMPLCKRINQRFGDDKEPMIKVLPKTNTNTNRQAIVGLASKIRLKAFLKFWQTEMEPFDRAERFFRLVKQVDKEFIEKDDFLPYIQELLHFHPGLEFLQQHEEFQRKYAVTVITRIFYEVNKSRSGKISLRELRNSNLMNAFMHVDEETDINRVTDFFSYEHFYVLYCRFFELDVDKDSKLMKEDLMKYSEHALSEAIVDR